MIDPPFLSLSAVADLLHVRKEKVVSLVRSGKLEKVDTGGKHPRFRRSDVLALAHTGFRTKPVRLSRAKQFEVEPLASMLARI